MTNLDNYIGYLKCGNCTAIVYIHTPSEVDIWHHPDDQALAEVKCPSCGHVTQDRISIEHMINFRLRGCQIKRFNDKFEPLTADMIDAWDAKSDAMDKELWELLS